LSLLQCRLRDAGVIILYDKKNYQHFTQQVSTGWLERAREESQNISFQLIILASPTRMVLVASRSLCTLYVPLYPCTLVPLYSLRIPSCTEPRPPDIQRAIRVGRRILRRSLNACSCFIACRIGYARIPLPKFLL
jgi:hypothetical protein